MPNNKPEKRDLLSLELAQSNLFADAALTFLKDRHIATTPENYAVAYNYVSATGDPALKRQIDILASSGARFTPALCNDLHNKFLSSAQEMQALRTASASVEKELAKLFDHLEIAGKDTSDFGAQLENYSAELSSIPETQSLTETLKKLVSKLFSETRDMQEKSHALEGKLYSSASEISKLKQNLEKARTETLTDSLTGIGNRKYLEEFFSRNSDIAETGENLALIMADVDHFKAFNDTWGHQMGDQVLKIVAKCLKQEIGDAGHLVRYGGEEFVIIMPSADLDTATNSAEKVRQLVAKQKMKKKSTGEVIGRLTVSFGTALYRKGENFEELVRRADEALYAAKKAGRNMVVSETDLAETRAASA